MTTCGKTGLSLRGDYENVFCEHRERRERLVKWSSRGPCTHLMLPGNVRFSNKHNIGNRFFERSLDESAVSTPIATYTCSFESAQIGLQIPHSFRDLRSQHISQIFKTSSTFSPKSRQRRIRHFGVRILSSSAS